MAGRAIRQRSSYDFQVGDKYDTAKFGDAAANSRSAGSEC